MSRRWALLAILLAGAAVDAQPASPGVVLSRPADLVEGIGERLGPPFEGAEVAVRVASVGERRRAARLQLAEAFFPLRGPRCSTVLERLALPVPDPARWDALVREGRPVADLERDELLVPAHLPAQSPADLELLSASGVLPFEVALTGEWARLVAARHLGPPPADPLLRMARAARLEGVARLAGMLLVLQGAGLDPQALGSALLATDRDRSGLWPRQAAAEVAANAAERAVIETFSSDGLRWAVFHYLRGGLPGLMAALERPVVRPAQLLHPLEKVPPPPAGGCRPGPRVAEALVWGDPAPGWAADLLEHELIAGAGGGVRLVLRFASSSAAQRACGLLGGRQVPCQVQRDTLSAVLPAEEGAGSP
ncbi:MAG TPA: hypothetical protein ENK10_01200 [Acidobacteria bacterium]|nr:hypothetical protein [Acidobacteriota bacterium]